MFKFNFFPKTADTGGSKKIKKEIFLLVLLLYGLFLRFLFPSDLKKIKMLNTERVIKRNELNRKKAEFFSTEELLKNPQKYEEEYIQAEKILLSLEEKLKYLKDTLAKKELLAEVLNHLTSGVQPGEMEFNLITMDSLVNRQYFNELAVKMKITSDFRALLRYINNLESLSILVDVRQFKISSPESNGILNVEADLVVYVSLH